MKASYEDPVKLLVRKICHALNNFSVIIFAKGMKKKLVFLIVITKVILIHLRKFNGNQKIKESGLL